MISKIPKETQILEIIDYMDFERIHEVMEFLKWNYAKGSENGKTIYGIPSEKELIATAYKRLSDVWDRYHDQSIEDKIDYYIESGGFKAVMNQWGTLELYFIIEQCMVEEEEEELT